ncbi:hypothetical protein N0V93_002153 [Gnomoniopsis smithogilvyi]|uniref:PEBP-like protein n=1 Tax=Gnomoniopsis smithogilvyi TaxID=1191159 RepID=A0A9W8YVZ0_9PEZI|nr:hypothetical protein N0V93_002153 [Gnomoniopsis smithogilvyi]
MRTGSCVLALVGAVAAASTPAGWSPSVNKTLGESFEGIVVTPGLRLSADNVTSQPDVYSIHNCSMDDDAQKYMLIMLDLNIPDSDVTIADEYDTLVPGLVANTTTRLHWWGGNYTLDTTTGAYVNSSDGLAPYTAPRPRDELYHNYVLYLFDQPASYVPSEAALNGTYYDGVSDARFNFSITPIIEAVGLPIAANYIIANNGSSV